MEVAKIVETVLFKSFFVGLILFILMAVSYHFYFDTFYHLCNNFYPMDASMFTEIVVISIGLWKLILLQLFLIPAVALHFTIKCKSKDE